MERTNDDSMCTQSFADLSQDELDTANGGSWAGMYNWATGWTHGMGDLGAYQIFNYMNWFM